MKPVYLMIGPALLGACLSVQPRTRTRQQNRTAPATACSPSPFRMDSWRFGRPGGRQDDNHVKHPMLKLGAWRTKVLATSETPS